MIWWNITNDEQRRHILPAALYRSMSNFTLGRQTHVQFFAGTEKFKHWNPSMTQVAIKATSILLYVLPLSEPSSDQATNTTSLRQQNATQPILCQRGGVDNITIAAHQSIVDVWEIIHHWSVRQDNIGNHLSATTKLYHNLAITNVKCNHLNSS